LTPRRPTADTSKLFALVAGVVVVAALYFARAVLVPFALAMLLSFLLAPLVRQLERTRLPRVPAVLLVVILAVALAFLVAANVTNQLFDVASQLPGYRAHIQQKVAYLHDGGMGVAKVTDKLSELGEEMSDSLAGKTRATRHHNGLVVPAPGSNEPVPVEVVKPPMTSWESLASLLSPVGVAGVVLVFTIFILLRFEDLRNRFIRLVGHNHLTLMTQALDDASQRITKYLLWQFIVNASYGFVVGTGLHFIGLPNALLWGVIAAVSRFIPYVGPPVGAFFPIVLSLAVFDGWTRSLEVAGFFLTTEIVVANIVEPLLYGANTGISSLAVLVAAVFWTLLWGPIGLVLSTPLTVCLVVIGRHVPQLEFLHVLLGDEPVLSPELHFYQRMLAADLTDARRVLLQNLEGKRLQELYDSVVIPALSMAQRDRRQDDLDDSAADFIWQVARELVDELNEEHSDPEGASRDEIQKASFDTRSVAGSANVVCIPARTAGDETVGTMLVHLLEQNGIPAHCVSLASSLEMIDQLAADRPDIVVISSLQPFGVTHARKLYALIKARLPGTPILLGVWNFSGELGGVIARLGDDMRSLIVTDLAGAAESLRALAKEHLSANHSEAIALR
jgi:predicted PurR-regulated permease PerM